MDYARTAENEMPLGSADFLANEDSNEMVYAIVSDFGGAYIPCSEPARSTQSQIRRVGSRTTGSSTSFRSRCGAGVPLPLVGAARCFLHSSRILPPMRPTLRTKT